MLAYSCSSKCYPCNCSTVHILIGCPVALSQGHFAYQHDQVLRSLASGISAFVAVPNAIHAIHADLPGMSWKKRSLLALSAIFPHWNKFS